MTPRCKTRIVFTVVALLPATFQALRPELSFDPIALILAIAIALAWLVVLFRRVRARVERFSLLRRPVFELHALMHKLPGRHRAIFK
jgi:hypothetical protein